MGPGPPARHLTKKQKRWLARLRTDDAYSRSSTPAEPVHEGNLDGGRLVLPMSERWKLHQREDEPLWGSQQHLASLSASGPSSASTMLGSEPAIESRHETPSSTYKLVARNPPINDTSPPVVVNPAQSPVSNMWMLQPPPPAAVMSGHAPGHTQFSRSRSTTISSTSSRLTADVPLSRQLSHRLVQERLNKPRLLYPKHRFEFPDSTTSSEDEVAMLGSRTKHTLSKGEESMEELPRAVEGSGGFDETTVYDQKSSYVPPSTFTPLVESLNRQKSMVQAEPSATQRQDFALHRSPCVTVDTQNDPDLLPRQSVERESATLTSDPEARQDTFSNFSNSPYDSSALPKHDRPLISDRPSLSRRKTIE